jgi:hypothetical protein
MKRLKSFKALIASLLILGITTVGFAAGETVYDVPVTLSVVNSAKVIDVIMPAAIPITVYNGNVLVADNVKITNNSKIGKIEIASIDITDNEYNVDSYDEFVDYSKNKIALELNGCKTTGAGALEINQTAFPIIETQSSLHINYSAKVSKSLDIFGVTPANIIFTLRVV